jgi:hypothetical protein
MVEWKRSTLRAAFRSRRNTPVAAGNAEKGHEHYALHPSLMVLKASHREPVGNDAVLSPERGQRGQGTPDMVYSVAMRMGLLLLSGLLAVGCSGGDETGGPGGWNPGETPVGGWTTGGAYACFAAGGALGVGDHAAEAEALNAGLWHSDGTFVSWGTNGTWSLAGGRLTMTFNCTGDGCGPFQFQRDASLACS